METCRICRMDTAQHYTPENGWHSATCTNCGSYKIDMQVMKEMDKGRRLNALKMKDWITSVFDVKRNPYPEISLRTAIWAN